VDTEVAVASSLTTEEFRDLFKNRLLPIVGKADSFAALQSAVTAFLASTGKVNGEDIAVNWSELNIVQDGAVVKNDEQFVANRSIRKLDLDRFAYYESKLNMAVIEDSGSRGDIFSIDDLRFAEEYIPRPDDEPLKIETLPQDHQSKLIGQGFEITFDVKSAFASHLVGFVDGSRVPSKEIYQALPRRFRGNVELPSISATVNYEISREGTAKLYSADLFVIEDAELNHQLEPSALNVPVPKGTVLSDVTKPDRTDLFVRKLTAESDIADVMSTVFPPIDMAPTAKAIEREMEHRPTNYGWLAIANVLTVIAICLYFGIRKLGSKR